MFTCKQDTLSVFLFLMYNAVDLGCLNDVDMFAQLMCVMICHFVIWGNGLPVIHVGWDGLNTPDEEGSPHVHT